MFLQTIGKVQVLRREDFGSLFLRCMNSTANPIIYLVMNVNIRKTAATLFHKMLKVKED